MTSTFDGVNYARQIGVEGGGVEQHSVLSAAVLLAETDISEKCDVYR